ncbi:MAG: hypothetical protein PHP34_07590 [Bacteroidales bacterium]|nr:hypothetical protein [Bacteroidales bacterium]
MKEFNAEKTDLLSVSICIILSVLYFVDLNVNMWTFHFSHGNVYHLCANMIAISSIFKGTNLKLLPLAYVITSIVWFFAGNGAIGFSAIIFFMWGTRFLNDMIILRDKDKTRNIYLLGIAITFIVSAILPNVSFSLHFIPFIIGVITGSAMYLFNQYKTDTKFLKKKHEAFRIERH